MDGGHPPGSEGGLLPAALDVDRAELLHAAQAGGRQVGIGQVCGFLTTARAWVVVRPGWLDEGLRVDGVVLH